MSTLPPLDAAQLKHLLPVIRHELRQLAQSGTVSAAAALQYVFTQVFGEGRTRTDRWRFMMFAAPIARRIAIDLADCNDRIADTDISVTDVKEWLGWLDTFDPLCARMIDLHYFGGLSTRETALVLKMRPQAVVRDLRFAKSWLQTKLI